MRSLVVPLQVVTPVFSGGSDPRSPELRAAPFRGAMRYWYRAAVGAALGDRDIDTLRRREAEVFGGAQPQAVGGPIAVRVRGQAQPRSQTGGGPGLRYLFFSMTERRRDPRTGQTLNPWRASIPPDARFDLILQERLPGCGPVLRAAAASVWLTLRLGAVGARERRGAGRLRAAGHPTGWPEDLPSPAVTAATPVALKNEIEGSLRRIRESIGLTVTPHVAPPSAFDLLHPDCCSIHVARQSWPSWDAALEQLGIRFQAFRNRRDPDYRSAKDAISGQSANLGTVRRAGFGLPIVFYFRSLDGARGVLEGESHARRASPLAFRVERLADGSYTLLLIVFRASLLEANERLVLRVHGRRVPGPAPGLEVVDEFIDALRNGTKQFAAMPFEEVDLR